MKKWDRESWKQDPWGRNIYGIPPQGNADYAFFQHIICSLKKETGRCAILWPHGILFRDVEKEIRSKLIEDDYIDTVIGLGPNLFYNSPMDSCIIICRKTKPNQKKRKIMFIHAYDQLYKDGNQNFLSNEHIMTIFKWYKGYKTIPGRTKIATIDEIRENNYVINVALYVHPEDGKKENKINLVNDLIHQSDNSFNDIKKTFAELQCTLREVVI
jgi:type I restriction enzyme M protein